MTMAEYDNEYDIDSMTMTDYDNEYDYMTEHD